MFTDAESIKTLIHDNERPNNTFKILAINDQDAILRFLVGSYQLDLIFKSEIPQYRTLDAYNSSEMQDLHVLCLQVGDRHVLRLYELDLFASTGVEFRDMMRIFNDYQAVLDYLQEGLTYLTAQFTDSVDAKSPFLKKLIGLTGSMQSARESLLTFLFTATATEELAEWRKAITYEQVKRWQNACALSMRNIQNVTLDSCLQACHRLIIMVLDLRKLSIQAIAGHHACIDGKHLDQLLKGLEVLEAQLHLLLAASIKEEKYHSAFCQWYCTVTMNLDSEPETWEDLGLDVSTGDVVIYINEYLGGSDLGKLLQHGTKADLDSPSFTVDLDEEVDFDSHFSRGTLPISQLQRFLRQTSIAMLSRPVNLLKQHWQYSQELHLTDSDQIILETRFVQEDDREYLYTLLIEHGRDPQTDKICMIRIYTLNNARKVQVCKVGLDISYLARFNIQDAKFIDDFECILLLQNMSDEKRSHLIAIDYSTLEYTPIEVSRTTACKASPIPSPVPESLENPTKQRILEVIRETSIAATEIEQDLVKPTKHRILGLGVHPVCLAINGRKGRRTGLYLLADRQRYVIFDLDDQVDDEDDNDAGMFPNEDEMMVS